GGTIFLDEVAGLPLSTQVRLLRVLETGEFFRVGSSKIIKTNVRVIAATNVDIPKAIQDGKFREDLFYRLNTVPIYVPPLRERKDDIHLLFRKFAIDFAERNRMPSISLTDDARHVLLNYRWPGNIRQLKNITEQLSVIETERVIDTNTMRQYLPDYYEDKLPALYNNPIDEKTFNSERELLYKILFDMKNDMNDLKKLVLDIMQKGPVDTNLHANNAQILEKLIQEEPSLVNNEPPKQHFNVPERDDIIQDTEEIIEESLSLEEKEKEFIIKALDKHNGKRKYAAEELGISERTLYRKIKEYNIN
ncbi:MAG TPA: sigma-54-dependent Fis family transcriptional regulator, partial [Bacteroidales bacterium]|nr:sigma-54-dependent Fis family transcriptional regulator [Bacteroidales bacterium]